MVNAIAIWAIGQSGATHGAWPRIPSGTPLFDESVPPVMVDGGGSVREETYPQTSQLEGGYSILELPSHDAALEWAAKMAAACRCAQEVRAFQYDPAS
jgi:hypothetical protein